MAESYKIVIVGSGVAGAILAYKLATHPSKPKILVLEAGQNGIDDTSEPGAQRDRDRFVDLYALTTDRDSVSPYTRLQSTKTTPHPTAGVDTKHLVQAGPDGFKSNYARLLGGSTWAWRGNCPRMVPADFELKKRYGVADDWPISYDELLPDFAEAEKELGIAGNTNEWDEAMQGKRGAPYPMPGIAQAFGDTWLKDLLQKAGEVVVDGREIRVVATPQARVSVEHYKHPDTGYTRKRCEGNASCIPICPTGAKYDAAVHIRMALMASKKSGANNVTFQSGCPVTVVRKDSYGRVVGVSYRDTRTGAKTDTDVDAQIVVLAANGIETPRLWLHSKLENTQDVVGRYLMDHIQGEAVCMTPVPIHPFRGPQNTSSIPSFIDHPKRNQVSAFNVSVGNDGWGRYVNEKGQSKAPFNVLDELLWDSEAKKIKTFGKALQHKLAVDPETALTCRLRLSFSTEQLPSRDNRVTLADEKDALGVPRPKITYQLSDYTKRSIANARSICREILRNAGLSPDGPDDVPFEYAGAGHIMGTCRMGSDPTKSVVNAFGRSHAYQNLWVVGSSVFVTGSCTNPTVTLAALTIRTARAIASELS